MRASNATQAQAPFSTARAALPSLRPRAGRNRSSTSGTEVLGRRLAPAGSDRGGGGDGNETGGLKPAKRGWAQGSALGTPVCGSGRRRRRGANEPYQSNGPCRRGPGRHMPQARSPTGIGQGQQDHEGSGERLIASPCAPSSSARPRRTPSTTSAAVTERPSRSPTAPAPDHTTQLPRSGTPAHPRLPSLVTSENGLGAEPPPTVTDRKQETPHTDSHRAGGRPRSEIKHECKREGAE